jgi:hypothetical protein
MSSTAHCMTNSKFTPGTITEFILNSLVQSPTYSQLNWSTGSTLGGYTTPKLVNRTYLKQYKLYCYVQGWRR